MFGVAGTNIIIRHWDNFGRNAGYALNGTRQSTLAYDSATGRLASMLADGSETSFVWNYLDGSDLKSSLAYPNGLTATWTYDANNLMLQVCNATPTNIISQYNYTYDAAGRRVACGKSGSAFAQNDTLSYGYNNRSELTNAVAAVDSDYRYAYDFDDIGNRETSSERGTNSVYTANSLNQYTAVDEFTPQFDDDGNQTLIKTSTGVWQVQYNGENRPILWENVSTNSPTHNSSTPTLISMSYGRRVTKNDQRFVYDGYLQIANFEQSATNLQLTTRNLQLFIWDPTEPVATRPLVWTNHQSPTTNFYTHDGNKNVSDVVDASGNVAVHYDYAPFGVCRTVLSDVATLVLDIFLRNPLRYSSEYMDEAIGVIYFIKRIYNPADGRWISIDPFFINISFAEYHYCLNSPIANNDWIGLVFSETIEKMTLAELQESTGRPNVYGYTTIDVPPLEAGNDIIKEFENGGCWCAIVFKGMSLNLIAASFIATNTVNQLGEHVLAESAIDSISAHEERRRKAMKNGYEAYLEKAQQQGEWVLRCGMVCSTEKGKAKQALSKYLNSVRQFAKGKYSSYNKTQQQAIDNENNYWLKNEDGLLIGYDPKKIHNVAEPPPVNEEDLPSCPVLK